MSIMQEKQNAKEARERLGCTLVISTHLYGLTAAVRAIIATHPKPELVRATFDQLLGQMQAHQAFLSDPDQALVLRDFAETLFQPQTTLDT